MSIYIAAIPTDAFTHATTASLCMKVSNHFMSQGIPPYGVYMFKPAVIVQVTKDVKDIQNTPYVNYMCMLTPGVCQDLKTELESRITKIHQAKLDTLEKRATDDTLNIKELRDALAQVRKELYEIRETHKVLKKNFNMVNERLNAIEIQRNSLSQKLTCYEEAEWEDLSKHIVDSMTDRICLTPENDP
jgi:uncharacterized coiled-coil protein SlyX